MDSQSDELESFTVFFIFDLFFFHASKFDRDYEVRPCGQTY